MAGSDSSTEKVYWVAETTDNTTPTNPAFKSVPSQEFSMSAPRINTVQYANFGEGARTSTAKGRYEPTGSWSGGLVYGEADEFFSSLFQADWVSNVLKNGKIKQPMTIQTSIPAGAGSSTLNYNRYRGVHCTNGSLNLAADAEAALSFDLEGTGTADTTTTALTGATFTAPTNTHVIGTGSELGTIAMSGLGTLDCMTALNIDFGKSGATAQPRIGFDSPCGTSVGVFNPTITATFYVEAGFLALHNHARAGTRFALTVPVGSTTGKKYLFTFPSCEFSESSLDTSRDAPAFHQTTITPFYDTTAASIMSITRAIT